MASACRDGWHGGLGSAMAEALVNAGATVALTSRSRERAEAAADQLGGTTVGVASDVRDEQSVAETVDTVIGRFGGIDLLVNNAGIGMRTVNARFPAYAQPFCEVDPQAFQAVLDTKVTGVFLVARAVVPHMLAAGSGRIVNISMSESTMTRVGFAPYGPSGAAVEAMSRIMAAELDGTGVRPGRIYFDRCHLHLHARRGRRRSRAGTVRDGATGGVHDSGWRPEHGARSRRGNHRVPRRRSRQVRGGGSQARGGGPGNSGTSDDGPNMTSAHMRVYQSRSTTVNRSYHSIGTRRTDVAHHSGES